MKTPRRKMQRTQTPSLQALIQQYACGAVHFSGDANASYERHVMFDHVVEPQAASLRERFEAVARSLRDLLVPRWLKTGATYDQANPKYVYYLSMEFLIGRSLTNNLTNLLVEPIAHEVLQHEGLDLVELAEQEPETRRALDMIAANAFSPAEPGIFAPIVDVLLTHGDYYMHLADLSAYVQTQAQVSALYMQPEAWARKAILNVGHAGTFSSDRTIADYAADIWQVKPCPVE